MNLILVQIMTNPSALDGIFFVSLKSITDILRIEVSCLYKCNIPLPKVAQIKTSLIYSLVYLCLTRGKYLSTQGFTSSVERKFLFAGASTKN